MANLPLTNKTKDEIHRNEVIAELLKTEKDYVLDLSWIIEGFLNPLKAANILSDKV